MKTHGNSRKLLKTQFPQFSPVFRSFPKFSPVFPSFSQFFPVFPSFPQFSSIFMTSKTSIFLRARRKNGGAPDRQEETHKKYIIHFTEIQFSPVLPSSAQFCLVVFFLPRLPSRKRKHRKRRREGASGREDSQSLVLAFRAAPQPSSRGDFSSFTVITALH